ncbi:rubrerythrin family protein [Patescibacteria group bacterium]|nr:rubrerythrin family protein [Patescibacteria group bacterium]MBU1896025.1 rubrerythrin family protein [Patescibacteria group bacterium]
MQKTLENLTKAFIGESQARNRYTYYAKVAKKEGYEQICGIFLETAEQEKIHAKREFEHIQELKKQLGDTSGELIVEVASPNVYGDTKTNLQVAIAGEHYEYSEMYPEFAKVADEEGLSAIAHRFSSIAKAEEHHEERYKKLLANLVEGTIFDKGKEVVWVCRECGYIHVGNKAPELCPSCDHPQAYYQLKSEEY